ncbi:MAG: HNH endonuclease signature motif containing protein [Acidimicrobiales bacterium]
MTLTMPGRAVTDEEGHGAGTVLASICEALGTLVGSFEPARFSGEDAGDLVKSFSRIERLALAGKTLAATRAAEAHAHRSSGDRTPAQWLARQTGESVGDAMGTLALGEALSSQPGVEDAFRQGKLSKPKARAVTGAVEANPGSEGELLRAAESDTLRQVRDRCARARAQGRSRQDEADRAERLRRSRSCRTWTDAEDGAFCLQARLTPDDGARVLSALRAESDRVFQRARRAGTKESPEAYAADALVALLTGESDDDRGPSTRRASTSSVHVRIDLEALRNGFVGPGQLCEIPGVGPIPVERAREVMGDALTRLVITEGIDVPAICNLTRHIPAPIGAALLERDPTCVVPGCDQADHLQIDHWQVDYAEDGPTEWWNLARLCPHHHRLKTSKRFRLEGGPGKWRFVANGAKAEAGGGEPPGRPDPPDPPLFPHTE